MADVFGGIVGIVQTGGNVWASIENGKTTRSALDAQAKMANDSYSFQIYQNDQNAKNMKMYLLYGGVALLALVIVAFMFKK